MTDLVTMAYDFGNEIHIIELNELGAHDGSPATVFNILPEGRDATLEAAGFRTIGQWSMQGICEGIEGHCTQHERRVKQCPLSCPRPRWPIESCLRERRPSKGCRARPHWWRRPCSASWR